MIKESALLGIVAKFAAIGTTITGAIAAVDSNYTASGILLSAVGLTTYVTVRVLITESYEKTKHVSPKSKVDSERFEARVWNNREF